VIYIFYTYL